MSIESRLIREIKLRRSLEKRLKELEKSPPLSEWAMHLQLKLFEYSKYYPFDELTKLNNCKTFYDFLNQKYLIFRYEKKILSIILCSLDQFYINVDTFGHDAGDACLRQVGQIIRENFNESIGMAGRVGHYSFGMIFPSAGSDIVFDQAEIIRKKIKALNLGHKNPSWDLTATFGVLSLIPSIDYSPEAVMNICHDLIYDAQNKGGDCVVVKEI